MMTIMTVIVRMTLMMMMMKMMMMMIMMVEDSTRYDKSSLKALLHMSLQRCLCARPGRPWRAAS
eukprot:12417671-Karenia_brevis.AAC.1